MKSVISKLSILLSFALVFGALSIVSGAQTANPVQTLENALAGMLETIILAIPSVIVFLIIILIGYFVAGIVGRALEAVFKLNVFFKEPHIQGSKDVVIGTVKAIIIILALGIAFSVLNLGAATVYTQKIAEYLPSLAGAIVLLSLGITLVNMLTDYIYSKVKSTITDPFIDLIFNVLRFGLIASIIVIAIDMAILYWFPLVSPYLFYDIIIGSIILMISFAITDRVINTLTTGHPELANVAGYARLIFYMIFLLIAISIILQPFYNITSIIQTLSWGLAIAFAMVAIPLVYGIAKRIVKEIQESK